MLNMSQNNSKIYHVLIWVAIQESRRQATFVCLFGRAIVINTVHNYFHPIQSNFVDQFWIRRWVGEFYTAWECICHVPEFQNGGTMMLKQQNNLIGDWYRHVAKGKGATDKQTFTEQFP